MSHQKSLLNFVQDKAVMIYGTNSTDQGQVSNGSGKSAILEAITICLTGMSLRSNSLKDLIKDGQDDCTLTLSLYNTTDKHTLTICRKIFANTKSATLEIFVDKKKIDIVSVKDGDDKILNYIGIVKEDLFNFFLISKERYTSFFSMSDRDKKDLIGRFSQSNLIDPVFEDIAKQITSIDAKIKTTELSIASIEGKIELLELQSQQREDEVKFREGIIQSITNIERRIAQHETNITDNINIINEQQGEIEKLQINHENHLKKLLEYNDISTKLKEQKKVIEKERSDLQLELIDAQKLVNEKRLLLHQAINCPKCTHQFVVSSPDTDLKKVEVEKEELEAILKEIESDLEVVIEKENTYQAQLLTIDRNISFETEQLRSLKNSISINEDRINVLKHNISNLRYSINELHNQIESLNKAEYIEAEDMLESINNLNQERIVLAQSLSDLNQERVDLQEWNGHFTRFKTHLSNKVISVMEYFCNQYLENMKSNLSIKMDGYKFNKDKSVRENITTSVLRDGLLEGNITKFSTGEKTRINVAMILALQKLINLNVKSGGLDLCFLDEVADGLDEQGIGLMADALNLLNQTIIFITFGAFNRNYPYIYHVEKVNGISVIHE